MYVLHRKGIYFKPAKEIENMFYGRQYNDRYDILIVDFAIVTVIKQTIGGGREVGIEEKTSEHARVHCFAHTFLVGLMFTNEVVK